MNTIIGFCNVNCHESGTFCVHDEDEICTYCGEDVEKHRVKCNRTPYGYAECWKCEHLNVDCNDSDLMIRSTVNIIITQRRGV